MQAYGVELLERLRLEHGDVFAVDDLEGAGFLAEHLQGLGGDGDDAVTVAAAEREDEEFARLLGVDGGLIGQGRSDPGGDLVL